MEDKYTLENSKGKIFAKANSIVDLRRKAYSIALTNAMKNKKSDENNVTVFDSDTFFVFKNKSNIGCIGCMVFVNKSKEVIDKYRKEIIVTYTSPDGIYNFQKDGTIKRKRV